VADRFYVGGNGSKWDLTSSWSASSGGAPGASVPTSADNIFFDPNSGLQSASNISYNTSSTLNCNNVTFSQAGLVGFGTGGMVLQIYGNAVFLNFGNPPLQTKFYGSGPQTLQSNGNSVVLYAYGISLTLLDDLTVNAFLIYNGDVDLNGHNVTTASIVTNTSGPGHLYLRSGTITINSSFIMGSTQIVLVPGTAMIKIAGMMTLYTGAPALYSVVTTGSVSFSTACSFTNLSLARGYTYGFQTGTAYGITNRIVQTGSGQTTIGLASGSSNFTWSSGVQQVLSNATINACTAIGAGHPFLAIGSSSLTKPPSATACVGWIGPKAIGFAGD
jgi:hypothetical protein